MTVNDEPILDVPLISRIKTGIEFRRIPGIVPEIEEREAARFALLSWPEYRALPPMERAAAVAHYRVQHLIEGHGEAAIDRHLRSHTRK